MLDTDNLYWFKRKKYGYGWTPCTWQGWVVLGVYILGLALLVHRLLPESSASSPIRFLVSCAIWTFIFLVITYRTGELLRWQWGEPRVDDKK